MAESAGIKRKRQQGAADEAPSNQHNSEIVKKKKKSQKDDEGDSKRSETSALLSSKPLSHRNHNNNLNILTIHKEDFYHYVNFRILDGMGYPGTYRKFMMKRKEQGAEWAIKISDHVLMVQQALKELSLLEQDIKKSSILKNLDLVWQHVVESNIPPVDMHLIIGTCLITSKANVPCIVIRGKGRGAINFTVSNKFSSFLYHLWVVYKIDILIKVYTRKTLEEIDPRSELSLAEIAQKLKGKESQIQNLAGSFHAMYNHVYRSAKSGLLAVV